MKFWDELSALPAGGVRGDVVIANDEKKQHHSHDVGEHGQMNVADLRT